jgi:DNA-binding LytR/AlgR family response regulator
MLRAYLVIVPVMLAVAAVNVFTKLDDARRLGHAFSFAEVSVWELSSFAAGLVASAVAYWAVILAPIGRRRLARALALHGLASLAYSILHVGLMVLIRIGVYAAAGSTYRFGLGEAPYEHRKDVIAYVALAGAFWAAARLARAAPAPGVGKPRPVTFDIQDGAAILRAPVRDILAVRAAGNYVEFLLADGRKPLMRAPLLRIETALEPYGFVRTHRSWIVNGARIRVIEAAGSGDFRVEIDGGLSAPVSRRFPEALKQLRGGCGE